MTIYLIRCSVNNKGYVGQTTYPLEKRWRQHQYAAVQGKSKQALHRALRKYGADAFRISVLCQANSLEELDQLEREYIVSLGTRSPHGYNTTAGGEGSHGPMKGLKHSAASKKKMSQSRSGVSVPSRGRPQAKGTESPFYGKSDVQAAWHVG